MAVDMEDIRKITDWKKRHLAWFESGYMADCEFLIGTETIKCHRFILSMESPVFDVCFNGRLIPKDAIKIEDAWPEHFRAFLIFLYTDAINFQVDDLDKVFGVYYCAEKYQVGRLKDRCIEYLRSILCVSNCLEIFEGMELFPVRELDWDLLDILQEQTEEVLEQSAFSAIPKIGSHTISRLLKLQYLAVDREIVLLKYCMVWASVNRYFLLKTDGNYRLLPEVVKPLLPYVRFKSINIEEFKKFRQLYDFATEEVMGMISQAIENPEIEMPIGFCNDSRQRSAPSTRVLIEKNLRVRTLCAGGLNHADLWSLSFSLNTGAATVHGIMLRGSRFGKQDAPSQQERAIINVHNDITRNILTTVHYEGLIAYGENVMVKFNEPVLINSKDIYTISINYYAKQENSYEYSNFPVILTMTHPTISLRSRCNTYTHLTEIIISQNFTRPQNYP